MTPVRPSPRFALAAVAALALSAGSARADVIDFTKANAAPYTLNGAIYSQTNIQPTGTGVFQPFVRIQASPTEAGYNTDARPVEFQTKDENQWTHSLSLASLTAVNINGTAYYQFTLDANEIGNNSGKLISMDAFQVYLGTAPNLTGYNGSGFTTNGSSTLVYNMDTPTNDSRLDLNYKLNHGSGSGDLNVFVPVSLFQGKGADYQWVYLYSAFGQPYASDAGFEEWSAKTGTPYTPPPNGVPAPPALLLGLMGFGCLAGRRALRREKLATA